MSKTLKILLIIAITLFFALTINYVQATSEENSVSNEETTSEEDITNEESTTSESTDENSENVINENASDTSALSTLGTSNGTRVEPINSYSEANLQLNNILSIILISIGVLLVLFAIALLIRIKK
ncbi:MAG TPA: hypothetical protein IAD08_02795 [Candidatus Scatovivens faecipullorum]|nr:hypothetical protein [Candidatus Scatovivens faecipullorum]